MSNLINTTSNAPSAILNTVVNNTIKYQVRYDYDLCADAFGILCYPNPTTGLLQIEREQTELLDIQIFDCLGRVLFTQTTNETQLNLDLTAYPTGIYTIQFKNATKSISQKVIKQ